MPTPAKTRAAGAAPTDPKTLRTRADRTATQGRGKQSTSSAPTDASEVSSTAAVAAISAPVASGAPRRKRLAKAFERPLDKIQKKRTTGKPVKEPVSVRDGFTFPIAEHAVLVELKKQLAGAGVMVKKSELIRVGLILASRLPLEKMKAMLARLPPLA